MNLKNYTSTQEIERSMMQIEKSLVGIGARNISKSYNQDKNCTGISFVIEMNNIPLLIVLPAKVDVVFRVMNADIKRPREGTETRLKAQAGKTAWKLIADWVAVQCSMIYLEQAEVAQIFLPYITNRDGNTFYERIKKDPQKLLG